MGTKTASRFCHSIITTSNNIRSGQRHRILFSAFSSGISPPSDSPPQNAAPPNLKYIDPPVPFSSQPTPPPPTRFGQTQRPFPPPSSPTFPLRQSPLSPSAPAPPGTDYLSFFQPTYGNALTGMGAFSPGSVLKVYPLPRFVLKEDILHHLGGSNLKQENVKLVYNSLFRPDHVQFEVDSATTQRQLMKRLQERGRLGCRFLKAEVAAPTPWTFADAALRDAPRGRTLIMWGVHPSTDVEDVERFFYGYNYDARHIRMINVSNEQVQSRGLNRRPSQIHVAVGFSTKLEALRAMREKTGDFCVNVAINLKFIQ